MNNNTLHNGTQPGNSTYGGLNGTSYIETILRDDFGIPVATDLQLAIFWKGNCIINTIGLIVILVVVREYFINKALRAQAVAPYFGQILADFLWVLAFFPDQWNNAVRGTLTSTEWCLGIADLATVSFVLSAVSGSLITIATYDTIEAALHRRPPKFTNKVLVAWWAVACFIGITWSSMMSVDGQLGSYRGMYCWMKNSGTEETGPVMFTIIGGTCITIAVYGRKTYRIVRDNTMAMPQRNASTMGSGDGSSGGAQEPWNLVAKRTTFLVMGYLCSTVLLFVLSPLNAAKIPSPVGLEIASGWMLSIKPIVDGLNIYYVPSVVRQRQQRAAMLAAKRGKIISIANANGQPATDDGNSGVGSPHKGAKRGSPYASPHLHGSAGGTPSATHITLAVKPMHDNTTAVVAPLPPPAKHGGWTNNNNQRSTAAVTTTGTTPSSPNGGNNRPRLGMTASQKSSPLSPPQGSYHRVTSLPLDTASAAVATVTIAAIPASVAVDHSRLHESPSTESTASSLPANAQSPPAAAEVANNAATVMVTSPIHVSSPSLGISTLATSTPVAAASVAADIA